MSANGSYGRSRHGGAPNRRGGPPLGARLAAIRPDLALFESVLEALPVPAILVQRPRAILANAAGREALERGREAWLEIDAALHDRPSPFQAIPLGEDAGAARCVLVVGRGDGLATAARRFGLTPRQGQVAELIARGLSNARIARALGCAEGTVGLHVSAVLQKMGCASRTEALVRLLSRREER